MVNQMREGLPADGNAQVRQVREIRGPQSSVLVHLREENFLGRSRRRSPTLEPPLQRPQQFIAILSRMTFLH